MAASATFALKAGVWFRRGRRCMVSPDSQATACPPSGRNSTYRPVQISGTGSNLHRAGSARLGWRKIFSQNVGADQKNPYGQYEDAPTDEVAADKENQR